MEAAKSPDAFKLGSKNDSSSGEMIGAWSKPGKKKDDSSGEMINENPRPGIKADSQKYQMIDEWMKPGIKSDRSSGDMIGENAKPGIKSDSSFKGKEAMRGEMPIIHENSPESEILCDPNERYSDFTEGNAFEKRAQINGGALNSSEKRNPETFQQIYGLTESEEPQSDDPMNNPMGY